MQQANRRFIPSPSELSWTWRPTPPSWPKSPLRRPQARSDSLLEGLKTNAPSRTPLPKSDQALYGDPGRRPSGWSFFPARLDVPERRVYFAESADGAAQRSSLLQGICSIGKAEKLAGTRAVQTAHRLSDCWRGLAGPASALSFLRIPGRPQLFPCGHQPSGAGAFPPAAWPFNTLAEEPEEEFPAFTHFLFLKTETPARRLSSSTGPLVKSPSVTGRLRI